MHSHLLTTLLLILVVPVGAVSVSQTNWSSGPGSTGPVQSWSSHFDSCSAIDWFGMDGLLTLGSDRSDTQMIISSGAIGHVWAADMDGDVDADVVGCNQNSGSIWFWDNLDGLGGTWSGQELVEVPWAEDLSFVTVADFNGDGQADLAVSYLYGGCVLISGDWPWDWYEVILEYSPIMGILLPCDVDEDGDIDLIASRELSWYGSIEVYENMGNGQSWQSHTQGYIVSDMDLADLDGDGDQDIAAARYWGGGVAWYENGPGCTFVFHLIRDTSGACAVGTGDVDGDGDIDIVADFGSQLEWYENDLQGLGEWPVHPMTGIGWMSWPEVSMGDFDHDGDVDLARWCVGNLSVSWNPGYGEAWTEEFIPGSGTGSGGIRTTDLDDNGISDFIASWSNSFGLTWFRFAEPALEGELTSSILELPADPHWGEITWSSEIPPGTGLAFQVRSSDDPLNLGDWSDTLTTSGTSLVGILDDYDNYCQYRVLLSTQDSSITPVLQEVCLSYDPLGIPGGERLSPVLYPVSPNPATGPVDLRFHLASEASVALNVYDIAGRIVRSSSTENLPGGDHVLTFNPPHPGVYFVTIESGDWVETRRFVAL